MMTQFEKIWEAEVQNKLGFKTLYEAIDHVNGSTLVTLEQAQGAFFFSKHLDFNLSDLRKLQRLLELFPNLRVVGINIKLAFLEDAAQTEVYVAVLREILENCATRFRALYVQLVLGNYNYCWDVKQVQQFVE